MSTPSRISLSGVLTTLPGVIAAAKASEMTAALANQLLTNASKSDPLQTLDEWLAAIQTEPEAVVSRDLSDDLLVALDLSGLALAITFVRQKSRQDITITPDELALVWRLIHQALTRPPPTQSPLFSASRSAQGFLTVPLCSLLNNGKDIDQLFRLHVWLPDGHRGNPDFAVHSHQPFIQAWILAGEGTDHSFKVEPVTDPEQATHAEYTLTWKAASSSSPSTPAQGKDDTAYKTHQASSTAVNTGKLVRAECVQSTLHKRDTSYAVEAGAHHRSQVSPVTFHATLCFFDAHRGFIRDAPALGPIKDTPSFTQNRDPAGATPSSLASMVESVRAWESLIEQGQTHSRRAELEEGLRCYNTAISMCQESSEGRRFPNATRCKHLVEGHIGCMYRRFGRYSQAEEWLQRSVEGLEPNGPEFVEFCGELAVIYRHMNRLVDAKRMCEVQCAAAESEILSGDPTRRLHFERSLCRAIGNLAMVNYQLYQAQQGKEKGYGKEMLDLAISQQLERVRRARDLQQSIPMQVSDQATREMWLRDAITWETIGLSRLSLYYSALGKTKEAVQAARESLERTKGSEDSTVLAMSHFFYGRALLLDGQREEALKNFNMTVEPTTGSARDDEGTDTHGGMKGGGRCTPAMAFCKEPSAEHREYLRQLVDAGADMDLVDEHGYTALDYAVFSGDEETGGLILDGMRRQLVRQAGSTLNRDEQHQQQQQKTWEDHAAPAAMIEQILMQQLHESKLRKGYRTLFQEKLRPVLLDAVAAQNNNNNKSSSSSSWPLQTLRKAYADALAADSAQRAMFDGLKFLRYDEFVSFGRLPRSSDLLARMYHHTGSTTNNTITSDDENNPSGLHVPEDACVKYIIFFSYRWINKEPGAASPDDRENTQFKRMITASELFMERHPEVKSTELGLWVVRTFSPPLACLRYLVCSSQFQVSTYE